MLGWRVHGVEPDERSAENARRSSGARIDAEFDEGLYPPAHFDVITLNHALEHIADPVTLLARCFRLCRPGGLLGIAVPNWGALGDRLSGVTGMRSMRPVTWSCTNRGRLSERSTAWDSTSAASVLRP